MWAFMFKTRVTTCSNRSVPTDLAHGGTCDKSQYPALAVWVPRIALVSASSITKSRGKPGATPYTAYTSFFLEARRVPTRKLALRPCTKRVSSWHILSEKESLSKQPSLQQGLWKAQTLEHGEPFGIKHLHKKNRHQKPTCALARFSMSTQARPGISSGQVLSDAETTSGEGHLRPHLRAARLDQGVHHAHQIP